MLRLLRAAALASPHESRPACHSARRASWKCFPENQRPNQQADEAVCETLPVVCRPSAVVDLSSDWLVIMEGRPPCRPPKVRGRDGDRPSNHNAKAKLKWNAPESWPCWLSGIHSYRE